MLGKLLKYEFKATARMYFPLYLAVLLLALLGRLSIGGNILNAAQVLESYGEGGGGLFSTFLGALAAIALVFYGLGLLGAYVVHFVITIQRFWKSLMGDEGYLMFTLPVSVDQLLWSKAIAAAVWGAATFLVVVLSVFVLAFQPWLAEAFGGYIAHELQELGPAADLLWAILGELFDGTFWGMMAVTLVLDTFSGIFLLYAAMAIGHTVRNHKVLASIGAYLGITMATSVVTSMVSAVVMPFAERGLDQIDAVPVEDVQGLLAVMGQFGAALNWTILAILVAGLVLAVGMYFATRYLLSTQLNLE